ncbi:MAG: bifunctional DNA-binding transcriptional regulator/O6-methylguanine-DNA methyltransferase Ada [Pyrinomonadaceae bacterium]|nr:bifunctional DNA-binding transcriptional regulator/O6-methylguanine-DNA methyltransferase Ada [Pyrinomonadaceae bacterium]MBP6213197.1 bifunctional DNA-binding transcriptional regulator/O6-methylguanine-DNA methyltransferase Ada [Pyrinomonadaceae bacterium]
MNTELYWQAVKAKDARFNGAFVFAVRTTGIFCKPSCSARLPKQENVEFFDAPELAESGGFRACRRCKPKQANAANPQVDAVLRAIRLINDDTELSLDEVSSEVGISSYHFQRTFKAIIGISPKKYAEARRMEKFKDELRGGSDVVTAMYEAGYGSSSRLYENATDNMGMTPAVYKKGGKGMNINYVITDCELGKLLVARTSRGICSVTFGETDGELADGLKSEFPNAEITRDDRDLGNAVDAIIKYLAGKNKRLVLPLDLQATSFQMQVWDLLRKIPYGETRSYGDLAAELGDRKKVRAVARACATNRVALLIPCHRVVASDGKLSGYRWGIGRKKTLLEKEKAA